MSFDPITAGFDFAGKLVDRLFQDPAAKADALFKLKELEQTGELARLTAETELMKGQIAVNQEEAKSSSLWIAGARPFFMWVCGTAFAYHYVLQPLIAFALACYGQKVELPVFDMEALWSVTMGMLGLGGMRTFEKGKRLAKG